MSNLSSNEVRQLSRRFRDISVDLGTYMDKNWASFPGRSGERLEALQSALLMQAQLLNVTGSDLDLMSLRQASVDSTKQQEKQIEQFANWRM